MVPSRAAHFAIHHFIVLVLCVRLKCAFVNMNIKIFTYEVTVPESRDNYDGGWDNQFLVLALFLIKIGEPEYIT